MRPNWKRRRFARLFVTVPLRGVGCIPELAKIVQYLFGYRPLAGSGVRRSRHEELGSAKTLSSPCGVWGASTKKFKSCKKPLLSSPCGVWGASTNLTETTLKTLPLFYRIPDFLRLCKGEGEDYGRLFLKYSCCFIYRAFNFK